MSTFAGDVRAALLHALVDDAALFPPGNAAMPDAVLQHRAVAAGPLAPLVGRFLCPASRLGQLRAQLREDDELLLGLIADGGAAGLPTALAEVASEPRLRLGAVEIPLAREADQETAARELLLVLPIGATAYVELPPVPGWRDALAVIAEAGHAAKLRTGGLTAELFPTEREVADFITACVVAGVAFKCTAGLHHAVRHTDPETGFEHHGFLNILLGTVAAVRGDDPAPVLTERDGAALADAAGALDAEVVAAARGHFVAFGSCSIAEPAQDLAALGLL